MRLFLVYHDMDWTNIRYCVVTFVCSEVPDRYYYRTAIVGQTIKFPCPTKLDKKVNWIYSATRRCSGTTERVIYLGPHGIYHDWLDRRFTVLGRNHSYSLVIDNVTVDDSVYYRCDEDVGQGIRHCYGLTVEGRSFFAQYCLVGIISFTFLHIFTSSLSSLSTLSSFVIR